MTGKSFVFNLNGTYNNDWEEVFEIKDPSSDCRYFIHLSIINHYHGDAHMGIILERMATDTIEDAWKAFYGYIGPVVISFDDNGDITFYKETQKVLRYDHDTIVCPASEDMTGYDLNEDEYISVGELSNEFMTWLNKGYGILTTGRFLQEDGIHIESAINGNMEKLGCLVKSYKNTTA